MQYPLLVLCALVVADPPRVQPPGKQRRENYGDLRGGALAWLEVQLPPRLESPRKKRSCPHTPKVAPHAMFLHFADGPQIGFWKGGLVLANGYLG